jgi:threonine/homoserine/homoserine lactone efflux protein
MTMMFVPDLATLATFTVASLLLFITPGPDMSLWLSRTIGAGRRAGIAAMVGTNAGCVVHTLLAAFGISVLIKASEVGFMALKITGAVYLLWLAVDAIRNGSSLNVRDGGEKSGALGKNFLLGLTVNLTNPKVVLFFITFLPQFVSANDPHVSGKLAFLGLFFVVINLPLSALMILGAERLVGWLKKRPRFLRAIDYSFAGVFAFFAAKILLTQSR